MCVSRLIIINITAKQWLNATFLFLLIVFKSDHQTFCSPIKIRRHVIGCKIPDIVVGLCSELFTRLTYCNHLVYGKKLSAHIGIEPQSIRLWAVYTTPRPERLLRNKISAIVFSYLRLMSKNLENTIMNKFPIFVGLL